MSKLSDFNVADFKQGMQIRSNYQHNKELWGGICFALMCEWFKLVNSGTGDATERMDTLEKQLKLCGSRQRIYKEYFAAFIKDGDMTGPALASKMSEHGNLMGVKFDFQVIKQGGAGDIKDFVTDSTRKDQYFYLSIKFHKGGGHAIGVHTGKPIRVYDPNFGEHEVPSGRRGSFFNALWSAYSGLNGGIKTAIVFGMSKQSSIFEFWEQQSKKSG